VIDVDGDRGVAGHAQCHKLGWQARAANGDECGGRVFKRGGRAIPFELYPAALLEHAWRVGWGGARGCWQQKPKQEKCQNEWVATYHGMCCAIARWLAVASIVVRPLRAATRRVYHALRAGNRNKPMTKSAATDSKKPAW